MKRQRGRGRVTLAAMAAMCAVAALPGQAWAAGEPSPYTFDDEAKPVQGTPVNSTGPELTAGSTYKDSIKPGEKRYYRIDLDATSNAYVSAVAVPRLGTKVAYADKLEVSIEDRSGSECSDGEATFGSATYARPVADYATRRIEKDSSSCQEAGAYYVLLERTSEATSTPEPWDVEIRFLSEPGLKEAESTAAPENWQSASPAVPGGGPQKRAGGTGFHDATSLEQGEWQDEIAPGRTLFYRVPVDWGQQLFVSADIGNSTSGDGLKSVGNAMAVALHNPARGLVDEDSSVYYDGKQKAMALDPLPPVAYKNRYDSDTSAAAMRFAGWYYLSVTLSPEMSEAFGDKPFPLTLRVNVTGQPEAGPAYDGPAGDFQVTEEDRAAADSGKNADAAEKSGTMAVVAAAGIGAGTVLVLGLGAWTLLVRRRDGAPEGPATVPAQGQGQVPAAQHAQAGQAQDASAAAYGPPPGYGYPPAQPQTPHGQSPQGPHGQGYGYGQYGPPPGR
ncbi:hypothetical protein QFZ82_004139 [Streptomyces sp. V4I23]|uniref:hypothetical protein n=1 Tax=Streptomyces sp. V4I23 TaxID=3042282 RepID=UPI002782DF60|nr:hypothetical protein [Streptomyces sp. V4I23]MDQ1009654.1 hypothetical protein [Streptomyces sp. V4I23]